MELVNVKGLGYVSPANYFKNILRNKNKSLKKIRNIEIKCLYLSINLKIEL